jgi:hypothetical protein
MFCLLLSILFFPFVLPFIILRFVLKLLFAILMVPFVLLVVVGALMVAACAVIFAVSLPFLPLLAIALIIWALTRHSRAATVYPG